MCGLAWQNTLHHHTHLPQLSLEDLAILCHRQAHALSLHLRQSRSLGLITYVGNKNGYLIRILSPGRAEQNIAPTGQNFASTKQDFAAPEQQAPRITANLVALGAWGIHPEPPAVQAVAALPHLTPEFVHAWGAELQQRA